MAEWQLPAALVLWIAQLSQPLHARLAWRLLPLVTGMPFAKGRRTVASWLRAAGLGDDFRAYYYFLGSLGRKVTFIASLLLRRAVSVIEPGDRLLFGLDDSPTKRYGPQVEGAGIHHNPTPGPADQKFLYGHVWVMVAWIVRHPRWGAIGLPLRALLYVRRKQMPWLNRLYDVTFQTKLEMAADLVTWLADWLRFLGKKLWIVTDGAYAKRPFLQRALSAGVVVVSRLRKDAALRSVPELSRPGQPKKRGRKPKYGKQAISLAKRAGHQLGWQTEEFVLYGKKVTKTFKTFLATYPPAGGLIRVVLVRESDGWQAFFCTDAAAPVELWAWDQSHAKLCDRSASPWDDGQRRPSHADRRNALRRWCIQNEIQRGGGGRRLTRKFRSLVRRLVKLVV
jgi:DDE superfamily endonuclease